MGLFKKIFNKDESAPHGHQEHCGNCGAPISHERARRMAGLCKECVILKAKEKKARRESTIRQSALTTDFREEDLKNPGTVGRANKLALSRLKKLIPKLTPETAAARFVAMHYGRKEYLDNTGEEPRLTPEGEEVFQGLVVWSDGVGGLIVEQGEGTPRAGRSKLGPLDTETFVSTLVTKFDLHIEDD